MEESGPFGTLVLMGFDWDDKPSWIRNLELFAKELNRTLRRVGERLWRQRHADHWEVGKWLSRVLNGWLNYFAVPGSTRWLRGFCYCPP